jgi:hypothetical protein
MKGVDIKMENELVLRETSGEICEADNNYRDEIDQLVDQLFSRENRDMNYTEHKEIVIKAYKSLLSENKGDYIPDTYDIDADIMSEYNYEIFYPILPLTF